MATPNVIPNANNEGRLGKSGQQWLEVRAQSIYQNGTQVASLASPAFTGAPTAPTPAAADNSTKIATTAFVEDKLSNDGYRPVLSIIANEVPEFDGSNLVGSGETMATLKDRSNHTGSQAQSTVNNNATLGYGGLTLDDDLIAMDGLISANAAAIAGKADASHTHVSADVTDATTVGTADKLAKHGSGGQLYGKTGGALQVAVTGNSGTSSQATGLFGTCNESQSVGVAGYNQSGTAGIGAAGLFYVGAGHTKRTILALADPTNQNDIMEFGEGDALGWTTWGYITSKGRPKMKNASGAYQTIQPNSSAISDETWSLPENAGVGGTLVGDDGQGVNVANFRSALGLATTDNPVFAAVQVTASTSDGLRLGASARLAMQSAASTTTWRLPSGGGALENLVDGDGRGITDAAAFRAAISALSAAGGTVTGTLIIDPSSGSNQLQLTGASTNTVTLSANPTANRAIAFPDAAGTITLGDGSGITSASTFRSNLGSTAVGDAMFIAANAAAGRTAIGIDQDVSTAGTPSFSGVNVTGDVDLSGTLKVDAVRYNPYMGIELTTSPTSHGATALADTPEKVNVATSITNRTSDTMDDNGVSNRIRYTGAQTRHFHVVAQFSFDLTNAGDIKIMVYHYDASSPGSSGVLTHSIARKTIGGTDVMHLATHADVMLDTNDYIEIWIESVSTTETVTVEHMYMFAMGMPG